MQFDFTFKNVMDQKYRSVILWFVLLHAAFFLYLLSTRSSWKMGLLGIIIIVLYGGYRLFISKIRKNKFSFDGGIFLFFSCLFFAVSIWWLGIVEGLLSILAGVLVIKRSIFFTHNYIELIARPSRRLKWKDLNNVVLKDDILTLDFKNNRILQAEIESQGINAEAFNTFAQEQLKKV